MPRLLIARAVVVVSVCLVTLTAQSPLRVTVIGCVRLWKPSSSAVAPAVVPEGETKYVLSNITLATNDDRVTSDTPAARSGQAIAEAVKSYRLDDSAHPLTPAVVGKRVEVTGTVAAASGHASSPPLVRIESVREMAVSASSTACVE